VGEQNASEKKGKKIMSKMKSEYGPKKGKNVFYASRNKGTIKGVERKAGGGDVKTREQEALESIGAIERGAGGIPVYVAEGNIKIGAKRKASGGTISNRGDGICQRGATKGRMV
jgi:hypothetical protein